MTARDMMLSIETVNAGTTYEFERVFIRCHLGHELRSISVENLQRHPVEFDQCKHYAHKTED